MNKDEEGEFSTQVTGFDRTQIVHYTSIHALASSASDIYTLSLLSGVETLKIWTAKQSSTTISHMFSSNDRQSKYTVQNQVFRYSLSSGQFLTLLNEYYTASTPTGAVEGLGGLHI